MTPETSNSFPTRSDTIKREKYQYVQEVQCEIGEGIEIQYAAEV